MRREIASIRQTHPELLKNSAELNRKVKATAGGKATVTCQGIAWISVDGQKLNCSGTLNIPRRLVARPDPEEYCIGPSSCDVHIKGCLAKHEEDGHFECHFTCIPWDGCCIGSCD